MDPGLDSSNNNSNLSRISPTVMARRLSKEQGYLLVKQQVKLSNRVRANADKVVNPDEVDEAAPQGDHDPMSAPVLMATLDLTDKDRTKGSDNRLDRH